MRWPWRARSTAPADIHGERRASTDRAARFLRLVEEGTASLAAHPSEWRPLMQAVAVYVAAQDALNDRTADEIVAALHGDAGGHDGTAGWTRYLSTLRGRDQPGAPFDRLAAQWLRAVGEPDAPHDRHVSVATLLVRCRGIANEALRACYGETMLPHDVPPSALLRR